MTSFKNYFGSLFKKSISKNKHASNENDSNSSYNKNFLKDEQKIKVGSYIGGRYKVRQILGGEGKSGMGIVYISSDKKYPFSEPWALKTFQDQYFNSKEIIERFKREALAWTHLEHHPHIVYAQTYFEFDSRPYIILEYIAPDRKGRNTLSHYLQNQISMKTTLEWAIQFCIGMEYALSRGVSPHRDVKPDNIMITSKGTVKITDFGLARIWSKNTGYINNLELPVYEDDTSLAIIMTSNGGCRAGTPPWMAPEQFDGITDIRSDIYSFGIVLYQMINNGKLPFYANTLESYQHAHKFLSIPKIDSNLFSLINHCLHKNPDERYQNFSEMRRDLEQLYKTEIGQIPTQSIEKQKNDAADHYHKGLTYDTLGLIDKAIKEYKKALEMNPNIPEAHYNLGYDYHIKNKMLDEAIKEYNEAIRLNPRYAEAICNMGTALNDKGLPEEAIEQYKKSIRIKPSYSAHYNLANVFLEKRLYDEAINEYKNAIRLKPIDAKSHYNMGIALNEKGYFNEAIKAFNNYIVYAKKDEQDLMDRAKKNIQIIKEYLKNT